MARGESWRIPHAATRFRHGRHQQAIRIDRDAAQLTHGARSGEQSHQTAPLACQTPQQLADARSRRSGARQYRRSPRRNGGRACVRHVRAGGRRGRALRQTCDRPAHAFLARPRQWHERQSSARGGAVPFQRNHAAIRGSARTRRPDHAGSGAVGVAGTPGGAGRVRFATRRQRSYRQCGAYAIAGHAAILHQRQRSAGARRYRGTGEHDVPVSCACFSWNRAGAIQQGRKTGKSGNLWSNSQVGSFRC